MGERAFRHGTVHVGDASGQPGPTPPQPEVNAMQTSVGTIAGSWVKIGFGDKALIIDLKRNSLAGVPTFSMSAD